MWWGSSLYIVGLSAISHNFFFVKSLPGNPPAVLGGRPLRVWSRAGRAAAFDSYKNLVSHHRPHLSLSPGLQGSPVLTKGYV